MLGLLGPGNGIAGKCGLGVNRLVIGMGVGNLVVRVVCTNILFFILRTVAQMVAMLCGFGGRRVLVCLTHVLSILSLSAMHLLSIGTLVIVFMVVTRVETLVLVGGMTRSLLLRQIPQLPLLGGPRDVAITIVLSAFRQLTVKVAMGAGSGRGRITVETFVLVTTCVALRVNMLEPWCVLQLTITERLFALCRHVVRFVVVCTIMM